MAIYATCIDGPLERPNGLLLVLLKDQARLRHRYTCQVVEVINCSGRTAKVGDQIEVERTALNLNWVER